MTNDMIILLAQQELLKEGKIQPTGRVFKTVDADGNEISYPEAEPIHTYAHWKSLGYQVQKGQKAITQLVIWKHVNGKVDEESGEEGQAKMFMKTASFFAAHQVKKIEMEEAS